MKMKKLPRKLQFGESPSGHKVFVSRAERARHMLAIGKSGEGKSKLLEHCIRHDILDPKRPGLLLIDPHGELYNDIVKWCAWVGIDRKIHLFNPSDPDFTPCYNPLLSMPGTPDAVARSVVEGFAQVYKEQTMATPQIRETLLAIFYALIQNRQTIAEAPFLTRTDDTHGIREYLTADFGENYVIREKWAEFKSLTSSAKTRHEFHNQMASSDRRLFELNLSPTLREIFGHVDHSLNIAQAMHDGDIVLVNLSQKDNVLAESDARLIGTLLLRDVFSSAKARDTQYAKRHPFYVYVDECYEFLTSDVEKMLDQTRKYGVHLILACQRVSQLEKAGREISDGVTTGTEIKVVFGGMSAESALKMAEEIFMEKLDLHRGVASSRTPVVVGHRRETIVDTGVTKSETQNFTQSVSGGSAMLVPDDGSAGSMTTSEQYASVSGGSSTEARTETHRTVLIPEFEDRYTQRWSIDELIYEQAQYLKRQPVRHAIVYVHSRGSCPVAIPYIRSPLLDMSGDLVRRWIESTRERSGMCLPRQAAKSLIVRRQDELKMLAFKALHPGEPDSYLD